ncbi:MAG TPA: hypothetical protein ENJ41_08460 [Oceanospirillales bacterium]|nr:hypothetical protein [Oceanospirillales bacterium]
MPNNTRRNWVARLPIMKKGGVHDKTNKAKRQKNKQMLKKQLRANKFGPYCSHTIFTMGNAACLD